MKPYRALASFALALLAPAIASAQEVSVNLSGEAVPVGPAGTSVVHVDRYRLMGARYAVIRSRSALLPSRCAIAAERVSAWTLAGSHWVELANEVFDRCPTDNHPRITRSVRAFMTEGTTPGAPAGQPELWVQLLDPRMPVTEAPLVRFHRVGDRLVHQHLDTVLASAPGAGLSRALPENPMADVDGSVGEWVSQPPFARSARGEVWIGTHGSRLHYAARVEADAQGAAALNLWLAEPGVSTAVMRGTRDNAGREIHVRCDASGPTGNVAPAEVRCRRQGSSVVIEGSTDLATMIWRQRVIREVSVLTSLGIDGHRELVSEAGMHLERASLASAYDLAGSATAEVISPCEGGFMGRAVASSDTPDLGAVLTCGTRCESGHCEHQIGLEGSATRLQWMTSRVFPTGCLDLLGPGREVFNSCRGDNQTRLVGQIPARGFDLVLAVERERADQNLRRVEVWALVTRSARWQRLWEGQSVSLSGPPATEVQVHGAHASVCRGHGVSEQCEQVGSLTLISDPTVLAMN